MRCDLVGRFRPVLEKSQRVLLKRPNSAYGAGRAAAPTQYLFRFQASPRGGSDRNRGHRGRQSHTRAPLGGMLVQSTTRMMQRLLALAVIIAAIVGTQQYLGKRHVLKTHRSHAQNSNSDQPSKPGYGSKDNRCEHNPIFVKNHPKCKPKAPTISTPTRCPHNPVWHIAHPRCAALAQKAAQRLRLRTA